MNTVKLKNGSEESKALVAVTMPSLKRLFEENPTTFYELVMKCRDDSHEFWSPSIQHELEMLSLIQPNGRPRDSIRNIVLSAVAGDGLNMALASPVAEESGVHASGIGA